MVVDTYINDMLFPVKVVEEWSGPSQWSSTSGGSVKAASRNNEGDSGSSDDQDDLDDYDDDGFGDGPPLFTAGDDIFVGSDGEEEGDLSSSFVNATVLAEDSFVQETIGISVDIQNGVRKNVAACRELSFMGDAKGSEDGRGFPAGDVGSHGHLLTPEVVGSSASDTVKVGGDQNVVEVVQVNSLKVIEEGCSSNVGGGVNNSSPNKIKMPSIVKPKKKDCVKDIVLDGVVRKSTSRVQTSQHHLSSSTRVPSLRGVVRNPFVPRSSQTTSSSNGATSRHVVSVCSVGDSGIRISNSRFVEEQEKAVAANVRTFAKEKLGLTGSQNDVVYIDQIRAMEQRDQAVHRKKGKNTGSK